MVDTHQVLLTSVFSCPHHHHHPMKDAFVAVVVLAGPVAVVTAYSVHRPMQLRPIIDCDLMVAVVPSGDGVQGAQAILDGLLVLPNESAMDVPRDCYVPTSIQWAVVAGTWVDAIPCHLDCCHHLTVVLPVVVQVGH